MFFLVLSCVAFTLFFISTLKLKAKLVSGEKELKDGVQKLNNADKMFFSWLFREKISDGWSQYREGERTYKKGVVIFRIIVCVDAILLSLIVFLCFSL